MENKYKKRAKEVLDDVYDANYRSNYKTFYSEQCILEAMCQLAEEVEFKTIKLCSETGLNLLINQARIMFTKEEVEELLQKQRELCSEQATVDFIFDGYKDYPTPDKESILNAKLKIDWYEFYKNKNTSALN